MNTKTLTQEAKVCILHHTFTTASQRFTVYAFNYVFLYAPWVPSVSRDHLQPWSCTSSEINTKQQTARDQWNSIKSPQQEGLITAAKEENVEEKQLPTSTYIPTIYVIIAFFSAVILTLNIQELFATLTFSLPYKEMQLG